MQRAKVEALLKFSIASTLTVLAQHGTLLVLHAFPRNLTPTKCRPTAQHWAEKKTALKIHGIRCITRCSNIDLMLIDRVAYDRVETLGASSPLPLVEIARLFPNLFAQELFSRRTQVAKLALCTTLASIWFPCEGTWLA